MACGFIFIYNSPVNIVTALELLAVEGLNGTPHDHIIETVLSKLFVRGDEVHKAYKHRTADFADLTDKETRRTYISEDFSWNNIMSPEVYRELRHVKERHDHFAHVDEDADDWYIVMKKIDTNRDLLRTLEARIPSSAELKNYVEVLSQRLDILTQEKSVGLKEYFDKGAGHVVSEVKGASEWAFYDADPFLTQDEVLHVRSVLEQALVHEQYFHSPIELSVAIDTNPDNILFLEDGVTFIDVMPPKAEWRVHDHYFLLCRTSADISALAHKDNAEILHLYYSTRAPLPPETVRMVYEIAAALIQVPYRKMVGRIDLAEKYAHYVRERTKNLELLLK